MTEPRSPAPALRGVRAAHGRFEAARTGLGEAVAAARGAGHSWAEIGTTLDMSRQAAFKRFGRPRDPRTGETMTMQDLTPLVALTERVFELLDTGDYPALRSLMTGATVEALTREVVLDTWAQVVAATGNLEACRDTRLENERGVVLEPGTTSLGVVVGHTTITCEAGEWWGRVAFDADQRVIGLLVVPVGTEALAF